MLWTQFNWAVVSFRVKERTKFLYSTVRGVTIEEDIICHKEEIMHYGENRVYKKIEVIGVSKKGIEDAIQTAVASPQIPRKSLMVRSRGNPWARR